MTTQPELPDRTVVPPVPAVRLVVVPDSSPDVDFDGFVRRYEGRLRRLVMRRLGDRGDAEEITQETLLRAYQHRASFRSEDELMAWSTVVAQRLVIDRVRVRGRSVAVAEVPETGRLGRDTAEVVVARHEARVALEALEAIPTRQAAILWAREVEGLHYDDIATRFDITEPAVRSLLHRGRRALRKEFEDRTGGMPLNGLAPLAPWLVALRAASQLRRAARTTASNPATAAVALGLVGMSAFSLAPGGSELPGSTPALARIPQASSATHPEVEAEALAAAPPARRIAAAAVTRSRKATAPRDLPPPSRVCVTAERCITVSQQRNPDGMTIWVGPPLPTNPTGQRRVGVLVDNGEKANCSEVPEVPMAVDCTERYSDDGPPPGGESTSSPAIPSGAHR